MKFEMKFVFYQLWPYRSVGRASAFGAEGIGFESGPHHNKGVKKGTSRPLADACIKGIVLYGIKIGLGRKVLLCRSTELMFSVSNKRH